MEQDQEPVVKWVSALLITHRVMPVAGGADLAEGEALAATETSDKAGDADLAIGRKILSLIKMLKYKILQKR